MEANIYSEGFIINYNEGDSSLERIPFEYEATSDDSLYTIKQDDTLITIANKFYGNGRYWFIIADINEIINPFDLEVGTNLIIPSKKVL